MADSPILPSQRLWTPWRLDYVGNTDPRSDCVFCHAVAGSGDTGNLVVYRGTHAFVIMNLYPYNTGHVMVVPNEHASDLAALSAQTRADMAELTASFCTGLRSELRCDGFNSGMNLGSAAGAGIADHLHQHIVPRWIGDSNFMPLIGGTKVLPELIPATYARIRTEVARQVSGNTSVRLALVTTDGRIAVDAGHLPVMDTNPDTSAWSQVQESIARWSSHCELMGWVGPEGVKDDSHTSPALAVQVRPIQAAEAPIFVPIEQVGNGYGPEDHEIVARVRALQG